MRKVMTIALFLGIAFSALQSGLIGINKGDVADINSIEQPNFVAFGKGDNADIN